MGLCVVIRLVDAVFRMRIVILVNKVLCVDHRCNVTMISAMGLVTKELVEANRLDCGKTEINTWYALRNIHCLQDGYDVFYYLRKTMNRIMERRLLLTDGSCGCSA